MFSPNQWTSLYMKGTSIMKELRRNPFKARSDLLIVLLFMKSELCCLYYFGTCLLTSLIFPSMSLKTILKMIEKKTKCRVIGCFTQYFSDLSNFCYIVLFSMSFIFAWKIISSGHFVRFSFIALIMFIKDAPRYLCSYVHVRCTEVPVQLCLYKMHQGICVTMFM